MIHLRVALVDGSFIDEEFPDHEIESVEIMVQGAPQELLVRVEIEDRKETLVYTYTKEPTYAY